MRKVKGLFFKGISAVLTLAMLFGAVACGGDSGESSGATQSEDSSGSSDSGLDENANPTVIKVAMFGGGAGRKWMDEAGARFIELVKDKSYEEGKKGVSFEIVSAGGVNCNDLVNQQHNLFFLQSKYNQFYTEILRGNAIDLNDIVVEETLAEYGENVTIESKLDENYRFSLKGPDGKYYMLPHVETQSGTYYDVDLFVKQGLYLAKTGEGTQFSCSLTGKTYYFTGDADEKTVGNDGVMGTDDDGMPTTLDELVAMCDHMADKGISAFNVSGVHIDYVNYLIEGLWTAISGYEQRSAVVSHKGTVDYVTGLSSEEIWPGSGIKYPIIEKTVLSGSAEGYKAINSAGRYYAYAFVELAHQQGWFYERYKDPAYSARDSMQAFILNGLNGNKKIASHSECSYWYNEAESYGIFNDYSILSGTGSTVKNIGYWHMPTAYGKTAEVVTGVENKREEAVIDGMTSTIMINGNIANKPGLVRACKDFLKFLSTEQELQNFTACNGVAKAMYNYDIDSDYVFSKLSPYQQAILRFRSGGRIVHQYGDNPTYRAKAVEMIYRANADLYHPKFDGTTYHSPLHAYIKTDKNAWDCFLNTGFTEGDWMSRVYTAED